MKRFLRRSAAVGALLALSALGAACEVDTTVRIDVEVDGSGTVTVAVALDEAAVRAVGDVDAAFRLTDLTDAGWNVTAPAETADGGATLAASKRFEAADQLDDVMAEVSGAEGPFRNFTVEHQNGFTGSEIGIAGTVALTGSLDQFSDGEVAALLDGFALGRSPEELAAAIAENPGGFTLTLEVGAPGELSMSDTLTDRGDRASAMWTLGTGEVVDQELSVTATDANRSVVLWLIVAGVLVVLGLVLLVAGRRGSKRGGSKRGERVGVTVTSAGPGATAVRAHAPNTPGAPDAVGAPGRAAPTDVAAPSAPTPAAAPIRWENGDEVR